MGCFAEPFERVCPPDRRLGRLCDEAIYQNDLADRLQAAGLGPVRKEVPVTAMTELLGDWGGFLELPLYVEALTHFLGGEEKVRQMVKLSRGGVALGNQRFLLLSPNAAFRLTALPEGVEDYEPELRALLHLSPLRAIQWINLARHRVQFVSLEK